MPEDQERRINELERRMEDLYGATTNAGERLAVIESKMGGIESSLEKAQDQFTTQIRAIQGEFKNAMEERSKRAHRHTVLLLMVLVPVLANLIDWVKEAVLGMAG